MKLNNKNSNKIHNLTETNIDNVDNSRPFEHQMQNQEIKNSGWMFDKINSNTIFFYKTGERNGSISV